MKDIIITGLIVLSYIIGIVDYGVGVFHSGLCGYVKEYFIILKALNTQRPAYALAMQGDSLAKIHFKTAIELYYK